MKEVLAQGKQSSWYSGGFSPSSTTLHPSPGGRVTPIRITVLESPGRTFGPAGSLPWFLASESKMGQSDALFDSAAVVTGIFLVIKGGLEWT